MAHAQSFALKNQLGLINHQLGEVTAFAERTPSTLLLEALGFLTRAKNRLDPEVAFYRETDGNIDAIKASSEDETSKGSQIDAIKARQDERAPYTAGRGVASMQGLATAQVLKAEHFGDKGLLELIEELLSEVAQLEATAPKAA